MLNHKILLALASVGFLFAGGCHSDSDKDHDHAAAGVSQSREMVAVDNRNCPIQPAHAIKDRMVSSDRVVEWHGKKIGFCCAGCPAAWAKMTDAQREAAVAKAM